MSDAVQSHAAPSAREDIAFMRALAVEGADGPILGGSILLATGLIYAAACVLDWLILINPRSAPGVWMMWIWMAALALQAVVMAVLILRLRGRRTSIDRSNRVFAKVWRGVGLGILSCLASFFLTAWLTHRPEVFDGYPAVILALYGVGWMVTAAASRERWTGGVAILSFLFAVASGAFAGNINLPLVFALALLLLLAAPGALLLKRSQVRS